MTSMRLDLTDDERALDDVFSGFFRRECPIATVRAAEPLGFDRQLWTRLAGLGGPSMGVPERAGGGGATLTDLAIVAERAGQSLAPVPFVEHQVAARILASFDVLADGTLAGDEIATFAVRPADGSAWELVPAGAIADVVVGLVGGELVVVRETPPGAAPRNHAAMPIADRATTGAEILARGEAAQEAFATARAEWQTLTAAALAGIGSAALSIALEYVKERHQFDRPIGAFQALQQQLSDLPIVVEGARLLAYKAAWARDRDEPGDLDVDRCDVTDFRTVAGMAFVFAGDAAALATERSLHAHGGYGYAEEYDIQLFYRRARGWALVAGDPAQECQGLADALFGPVAA